jgi:hypothetical protein
MLGLRILLFLTVGSVLGADLDSDRDGLSDYFEQALLQRFAPRFHISKSDCDLAPAEFLPGSPDPQPTSRNGTVYGQVFPIQRPGGSFVEIHFYHLWAQDCGMNRHPLDAESVSGLLRSDGDESAAQAWRAEFWLAAAHEDTLCDVSNGATAAAVAAIDHGPDVWVSRGKHASFLSLKLCAKGCGRDSCDNAQPMRISNLINLGEPGAPMNDTLWSQSASWSLASKMTTRYTSSLIERMPAGSEVEFVPSRDVVRGGRSTIKVAARTYGSLVSAHQRTESFIRASRADADAGLATAGRSARETRRSLKSASSAARKWLRTKLETATPQ